MIQKNLDKLYLVIPKLIEQPTWGGRYILQKKHWTGKSIFKNILIGQSYELFSGTFLRTDILSTKDNSFTGQLGYAMQPNEVFYKGDKKNLLSLKKLISANPKEILGERAINKFGSKMRLLIKFTQAKGNSFQIHVRPKDHGKIWHAKPESWYYFEPGLLTLGVKKTANWQKYEDVCLFIQKEMAEISREIKKKKITLEVGKQKAKQLIKKYNPWQFVNLIKVKKDQLVDLSYGGFHHSWEEDDQKYPLGNVVYEVSIDEMDPISTVRAFDKGKIKKDGSLRKIDPIDYFKYIDRSWQTNNSKNHIIREKTISSANGTKIVKLLATQYYSLDKIILGKNKAYQIKTQNSFNHLFVKKGVVQVSGDQNSLKITSGHSCFIPATVANYKIQAIGPSVTEILKTFI